MRNVTGAIVAAVVLLLASAQPVQAWGGYGGHHGYGHHGFGGHYGYGFFGGHYGYPTYGYGYPYRAYSASDAGESQPTVYVQQQFYWYFCEDAKAYYPYVKQCPDGWRKVVPLPSPPAQ